MSGTTSPAPGTERRFLSSTVAAYGSQMARIAIRFAADITLARLIIDDQHGLFDLAFSAVLIAGVVRDFGLPYQLVRDEREPWGTVLGWSAGMGLLTTLALVVAAPIFGGLDPDLPTVVAVLAPFVFLDSLAVVPRIYFERRLRVGRLVIPEIARGLAVAVVAIALAWRGAGVWALVAGEMVGLVVVAGLLWWRFWGQVPLVFDASLLPDLLRRSRWLFAIALSAFALPHVERFVLGSFVTTALVGQYNKARLWGLRMQTIVVPAVARVLYPALVEYRDDDRRAFGAYRIGTLTILAFEVLAGWFIFFNAEMVQRILLGEGWEQAVPLLRILCLLPLVDPFSRLGGEVLKARGRDRLWLVIVLLNGVSLLGFGIFLASRLGATGMAWANFLLVGNLLMAWAMARVFGGRRFWRMVGDLLYLYLMPLPLFLAVVWTVPEPGWTRLGLSAAAGGLGFGLYTLRYLGPFRRFFFGREGHDVPEDHDPPGSPEDHGTEATP